MANKGVHSSPTDGGYQPETSVTGTREPHKLALFHVCSIKLLQLYTFNCYLTLTPSFRHRSAEVGQAQVEVVDEVLFCLSLRPVSKQIGSLGVLILFTHCLCVVCFYHSVLHAKVISQQASENLSHKALIQRGRI